MKVSTQLSNEVSKISDFLDVSRDKRKWAEESVRGLQGQLRSSHKRLLDVKKCYESKCKDEIHANHQYHQVAYPNKNCQFNSNILERGHIIRRLSI